jgi:hypothetical protein
MGSMHILEKLAYHDIRSPDNNLAGDHMIHASQDRIEFVFQ